MSERVSDERLAAALNSDSSAEDALLVHGARSVALDLRDCRAERDALRAQVAALRTVGAEVLRCIEDMTGQAYGNLHENDLNASGLRRALAAVSERGAE